MVRKIIKNYTNYPGPYSGFDYPPVATPAVPMHPTATTPQFAGPPIGSYPSTPLPAVYPAAPAYPATATYPSAPVVAPTSAARTMRNIYTAEAQRRELFVETIKKDIQEIEQILRNLDVPYEVIEKEIQDLQGECSGVFLPKDYAKKQAIIIIKEKTV